MAARKLQKEIEQTLKRVTEGIELFDDIQEKVGETEPGPLRDKYEGELKKEIKKLQRMRDSIKSWIGNRDVSEKDVLISRRRDIEERMEIFKNLERMSKMKAFSKAGLSKSAKMRNKKRPDVEDTPEKLECKEWVEQCVETLQEQLEELQEELGGLQEARKPDREQVESVEESIERHRTYLDRLEEIIDLLDEDVINVDDVDEIKESVNYYVEEFSEPDFVDDEYWFDSIMEKKEQAGEEEQEEEEEEEIDPEQLKKEVLQKIKKQRQQQKKTGSVKSKADPGLVVQPTKPTDVFSTLINNSPVPSPKVQEIPKTHKDKGAAKQQTTEPKKEKKAQPAPTVAAQQKQASREPTPPVASSPVPSVGTAPMPATFSAIVAKQREQQQPQTQQATTHTDQAPTSRKTSQQLQHPVQILSSPRHQQQQTEKATNREKAPEDEIAAQVANLNISGPQTEQQQQMAAILQKQQQQQQQQPQQQQMPFYAQQQSQTQQHQQQQLAAQQAQLQQQQQQLLAAQQGQMQNLSDASPLSQYQLFPTVPLPFDMDSLKLEQSFSKLPQASDVETPTRYTPINPCLASEAFPSQVPPIFNDSAIFNRMDLDTLFFIFYFQQGTIYQYYAAKRLKELSWRYHKKYHTWFQRHEQPKIATSEYEMGTYVYFDYESGWCQRIKQEFQFEYAWLE